MIRNFKTYNYYLLGTVDEYGQDTPSTAPAGTVKMAIYLNSQLTENSVDYNNQFYTGLTNEAINDNMIIQYGEIKLKVLNVNTSGRFSVVQLVKVI